MNVIPRQTFHSCRLTLKTASCAGLKYFSRLVIEDSSSVKHLRLEKGVAGLFKTHFLQKTESNKEDKTSMMLVTHQTRLARLCYA